MTDDVRSEDIETEDIETDVGSTASVSEGLHAPSLSEDSSFRMIRFRTLPFFLSSCHNRSTQL